MMYEAGIFTYKHGRVTRDLAGDIDREYLGFPFACFIKILDLFTDILGIVAQIYLMYSALSAGSGAARGLTAIFLIFLSLAPTIIRLGVDLLRPATTRWKFRWIYNHAEGSIDAMTDKPAYRQEALLFGLREWVLARWDRMQEEVEAERLERRQNGKGWDLGLDVVAEGFRTSFYVSQIVGRADNIGVAGIPGPAHQPLARLYAAIPRYRRFPPLIPPHHLEERQRGLPAHLLHRCLH